MFNRLLRENPSVKCELDRILAPVDPKDYIFIEECLSGIAQGKTDVHAKILKSFPFF